MLLNQVQLSVLHTNSELNILIVSIPIHSEHIPIVSIYTNSEVVLCNYTLYSHKVKGLHRICSKGSHQIIFFLVRGVSGTRSLGEIEGKEEEEDSYSNVTRMEEEEREGKMDEQQNKRCRKDSHEQDELMDTCMCL